MTQQEFESRTSLKCTTEEFDLINRIYLAAGQLDKDAFCEDLMKNKKILDSRIVGEMLYHCERLAKTVDSLNRAMLDQAVQMDAARKNMEAYRKQIDLADQKAGRLQKLVDATIEEVNLATFKELRNEFEYHLGKVATMRMRTDAGWTLDKEEIAYLLDHCVEE